MTSTMSKLTKFDINSSNMSFTVSNSTENILELWQKFTYDNYPTRPISVGELMTIIEFSGN